MAEHATVQWTPEPKPSVEDVLKVLKQMSKWQQDLGGLAQMGGYVECQNCRLKVGLQPEAIKNYLQNGWPKCCGQTMQWVTQKQIDAQKAQEEDPDFLPDLPEIGA